MERKTEIILLIALLVFVIGILIFTLKDFFGFDNNKINGASSQKNMRSAQINFMDDELAKDERIKSANIGPLGSQHIHADFKIFINGNPINFADDRHYMKSNVMHLDDNQNKDDASGMIHMHATGVPFWYFLRSVGINSNNECITLENQKKLCNNGGKKLRFFINGKEHPGIENYVFNDLDKILITYGNENEDQITNQINSITNFAKFHRVRNR